jgi:hypothetical protein
MINQDVVSNLKSIVNHLKSTDGYKYFNLYFSEKRKELLEELLKESGSLTIESLIEGNSKMSVYEELINLDSMLNVDTADMKSS